MYYVTKGTTTGIQEFKSLQVCTAATNTHTDT